MTGDEVHLTTHQTLMDNLRNYFLLDCQSRPGPRLPVHTSAMLGVSRDVKQCWPSSLLRPHCEDIFECDYQVFIANPLPWLQ